MVNILIVEDEPHIAEGLKFNLAEEGFDTAVVTSGEAALELLATSDFDAVVLDVMLPGITGFEVASSLRDEKNYTPILMLTARGRPEDVLEGFASGADDYLPKPFELEIFLARLRGLLRRSDWSVRDTRKKPEAFEFEGRKLDFSNLEITTLDGEKIPLTLMEANLLRHFVSKAGLPVSRKEILEEVWGLHEETDTRAIDNFIVRLRRYIEKNPSKPEIIKTVRGVGYKFETKEDG